MSECFKSTNTCAPKPAYVFGLSSAAIHGGRRRHNAGRVLTDSGSFLFVGFQPAVQELFHNNGSANFLSSAMNRRAKLRSPNVRFRRKSATDGVCSSAFCGLE